MPLALAIRQGSAIQPPLAISIIAGLILQFPLVLLVMPVLIGFTIKPPSGAKIQPIEGGGAGNDEGQYRDAQQSSRRYA